jgi:acyl-CoA reductase-like NAD-dependent aldehyde dehydrogenase
VFALTKHFSLFLGIALCAAGTAVVPAADDPGEKRPGREETEKRKENWKKLSPEEREAKRKEIKARLEKRIGELRMKQTDGTITASEARELARSEQILKRFEQNAVAAKADGAKSKEPVPTSPPEKGIP